MKFWKREILFCLETQKSAKIFNDEAGPNPVRERGNINITFTPRVFPTPQRESLSQEEEAVRPILNEHSVVTWMFTRESCVVTVAEETSGCAASHRTGGCRSDGRRTKSSLPERQGRVSWQYFPLNHPTVHRYSVHSVGIFCSKFFKAGDVQAAINAYSTAIRLNPKLPSYPFNLPKFSMFKKNTDIDNVCLLRTLFWCKLFSVIALTL